MTRHPPAQALRPMGAEPSHRTGAPRRSPRARSTPAPRAGVVAQAERLPVKAPVVTDAATCSCAPPSHACAVVAAPGAGGWRPPTLCRGTFAPALAAPPRPSPHGLAGLRPRGPVLRIILPGTHDGVRHALARVADALRTGPLAGACPGAAADGTIELLLAEVLNNIVEHAYAEGAGLITLDLRGMPGRLCCLVRDEGHPMPAGRLPEGLAPTIARATPDLPEGGFGWFLIRSLTRELRYEREPGCNRLSFSILDPGAARRPPPASG